MNAPPSAAGIIMNAPPSAAGIIIDVTGGPSEIHQDDLPENHQDAGHDQEEDFDMSDTLDGNGPDIDLWKKVCATLPDEHEPWPRDEFMDTEDLYDIGEKPNDDHMDNKDDIGEKPNDDHMDNKDDIGEKPNDDHMDNKDDIREKPNDDHMDNKDDIGEKPNDVHKDNIDDIGEKPNDVHMDNKEDIGEKPNDVHKDNIGVCSGLMPKEQDGRPSKKLKLTGKDEVEGPDEKPNDFHADNKSEYCRLCKEYGDHDYFACVKFKVECMGVQCLACMRNACKKCLKDHRPFIYLALKRCRYCNTTGDHWEDKCPVAERDWIRSKTWRFVDSDEDDMGF